MPKAGNINRNRWLPGLLSLAMLAALVVSVALAAACAPAAGAPATSESGGVAGVDAGATAPPFAMQLADGSQVTLKNLVDDRQPVFMMYFATW